MQHGRTPKSKSSQSMRGRQGCRSKKQHEGTLRSKVAVAIEKNSEVITRGRRGREGTLRSKVEGAEEKNAEFVVGQRRSRELTLRSKVIGTYRR